MTPPKAEPIKDVNTNPFSFFVKIIDNGFVLKSLETINEEGDTRGSEVYAKDKKELEAKIVAELNSILKGRK